MTTPGHEVCKPLRRMSRLVQYQAQPRGSSVRIVISFYTRQKKGAPFPAALQYRVDAWSEWSKPLFQLPSAKIHLICCPLIEDISDIKLIRTDTTLDLSQKAEKR